MGFYDERCMVTGVSLKGADAALVLLQQEGRDYHPIALAIKGNYNRLGSIDGIEEDANTRLVLTYFLKQLEEGQFVVEADYLETCNFYPIEDIERLLGGFERNINDNGTAAVLDARPVAFALISKTIWEAIAAADPLDEEELTDLFEQVFEDDPIPAAMYDGQLKKLAGPLRELAAVSTFLAGRGIKWHPAEDGTQDYAEEMRGYIAEARRIFEDAPVILAALNEYEQEVADLLEDA